MAYVKQTWVDRIVEFAKRFTYTDDGTYLQLTSAPGTVTEAGSPINASRLNHLEDGLVSADLLDSFNKMGMVNLIKNGDFSSGTSGWAASNATISASANQLSVTPSAQYGGVNQTQITTAYRGHQIYFGGYLKSSAVTLFVSCHDGAEQEAIWSDGTGLWQHMSGVKVISLASTQLAIVLQDNRVSGWDTSMLKYLFAIDLTAAFGAGNEPTVAQMDAWLATFPNSWFDNNAEFDGFVPIVTSAVGSITSYTASSKFIKSGKLCIFTFIVLITNKGTATGDIIITLPISVVSAAFYGTGGEAASTGVGLLVYYSVNDGKLHVAKYDGTSYITNNFLYVGSITLILV